MAPEVPTGKYDFRADLWSTGLIFLEILVANEPWKHVQRYIANEKRNFFTKFYCGAITLDRFGIYPSDVMMSLINGLLAHSPESRFTFE